MKNAYEDSPLVGVQQLSPEDLQAMSAEELVSFGESLGLYLSMNAEKGSLLSSLYRFSQAD
jgi:hypothetical protein